MSDNAVPAAASPAAATPKKKAKVSAKKPKPASTHPKVAEMVNSAISSLKERGGSSLQAIKKHIASQYKVDVDKLSPFIKKYLKSAVASGTLVQTKGKGATGSFKLGASGQKSKETASVKQAKKTKRESSAPAAKKTKTAAAKKASKPKPKVEKKKASAAKKTPVKKAAPKTKAPKKAAAKSAKPKTPKKAKPAKKATPKKAAKK